MVQRTEILSAALSCFLAAVLSICISVMSGCVAPAVTPEPPVITNPPQSVISAGCCPATWPGTHDGASHQTRLTGYYPDSSALEGGFNDRYGQPLRTLQGFLAGRADYVSVAMDKNLGKVKRKVCSPELNAAYGKPLALMVVDTGGAFTGKGWGRMDIATANRVESERSAVNRTVEMRECE